MKRIVALILCLSLSLSCSGALALSELINPNVSQFCFYYMQYAMALSESVDDFSILEKLAFSAGKIGYFDHDARTGYTGQKVADGGASNQLGTCTLGVGAGLSNENLWYVTNLLSRSGLSDPAGECDLHDPGLRWPGRQPGRG